MFDDVITFSVFLGAGFLAGYFLRWGTPLRATGWKTWRVTGDVKVEWRRGREALVTIHGAHYRLALESRDGGPARWCRTDTHELVPDHVEQAVILHDTHGEWEIP